MARRTSLKPQLNQIRTWVAEGVTDIWIAHQLDSTPAQIATFRRQQGLLRPDEAPTPTRAPRTRTAAKPAAAAKAAKPAAADDDTPAKKPRRRRTKAAEPPAEAAAVESAEPIAGEAEDDADATAKRRRRGRRGGRGRARRTTIPATIEQTADGLVIRVDAAVLEHAAFAEHWSERSEAVVAITASAITVGPAPAEDATADADAGDEPAADAPQS